jgi:hypothetical protein
MAIKGCKLNQLMLNHDKQVFKTLKTEAVYQLEKQIEADNMH